MWYYWIVAFVIAFAVLVPVANAFKRKANELSINGKTYKIQ